MLELGRIYAEKRQFQISKELININVVDIKNIIISNRYYIGKKLFQVFHWLGKLIQ